MKYRISFVTSASGSITVETDETDPERIVEEAYAEGIPGICAQCSGWGRDHELEVGDEWDVDEDDKGPVIYTDDGERYVAPE